MAKITKKELREASDEELLYNILLSERRFGDNDDMPDELFIIEQSRDFVCRDELKRRGRTDEWIEKQIQKNKEKLKSRKVKCSEDLKFVLCE